MQVLHLRHVDGKPYPWLTSLATVHTCGDEGHEPNLKRPSGRTVIPVLKYCISIIYGFCSKLEASSTPIKALRIPQQAFVNALSLLYNMPLNSGVEAFPVPLTYLRLVILGVPKTRNGIEEAFFLLT